MRFDEETGERLVPVISGGKLTFVSMEGKQYEARPEDTLLFQMSKASGDKDYREVFIKNASDDHALLREYAQCPECKKKVIAYVIRTFTDGKILVCSECDKDWNFATAQKAQ